MDKVYFISRINVKSRQTINKRYRQFKGDLWGLLSQAKRTSKIVKQIAKLTFRQIRAELIAQQRKPRAVISELTPKQTRRIVQKYVTIHHSKLPYEITAVSGKAPSSHPKRIHGGTGIGMITRRKFSYFYGANRIRIPTFQRYAKPGVARNIVYNILKKPSPRSRHRTEWDQHLLPTIMETRTDVFLFRSGFFETIYQARILCFYKKASLLGKAALLHPRTLIKPFEICSVRHYKFVKRRLRRYLKYQLISFLPSHIFVSYTYMYAFMIQYPTNVGYPSKGLQEFNFNIFRYSF